MSWRDQLRKASFRGVEFLIDSADGTFGRRTVTHEYPLRDKPYVEDLGRKARTFTVEAFVLATGANARNYMPARDALIAALEQAGPGVLVHPYLGEMRVSLTDSKLRESTKEGGIAHFTLSFVESGEITFPTAQASTPAIVNARADEAEVSIAADFAKKFAVAKRPAYIGEAARDLFAKATTLLTDVTKRVSVDQEALAEYLPGVKSLGASLQELTKAPLELAQAVVSEVDSLRGVAKSPRELAQAVVSQGARLRNDLVRDPMRALSMLRELFTFGNAGTKYPKPSVPLTTTTRLQQAQNQDAITQLVQRAAVVSGARAAASTEFSTFDDAVTVRTELADRLDVLMSETDSDDVYNSLARLRAATVKDISTRGADLARVVSYTPADSLPAVVLAYDLYDDASRDAEIVLRNGVRHPGFVPGGRPLEVLTIA